MDIFLFVGVRHERYEGEHAPEVLAAVDEFTVENVGAPPPTHPERPDAEGGDSR